MIANNSTNNDVFFFVTDLNLTTINPQSQCRGQERKKYFASQLIWRQNQNCLKIDVTH